MERFAITHFSKESGLRQLTFANQGRNFYVSREDAEKAMVLFMPDLRAKILGDAANSLEVRSVDCYDNGDAKGIYFPMCLRKVTGTPFHVTCFSCGKRLEAGDGHSMYADETGTPWKAYYCADCSKNALQIQEVR